MKKTSIILAALALSLPVLASVPQSKPTAPQADELQARDTGSGGRRCYRDANGQKVCVATKKS